MGKGYWAKILLHNLNVTYFLNVLYVFICVFDKITQVEEKNTLKCNSHILTEFFD